MAEASSPRNVLDSLFHPQSVAVIGVMPGADENRFGGQYYIRSIIDIGYKGRLYAVGIKSGEYRGLHIYPKVTDIPDPIEYAIIAVPARIVPKILADCGDKGIHAVHIFSAGFSELSGETGKKLQEEIIEIARRQGIRFIGPNCMGVYSPAGGLTFNGKFTTQSGTLSFISQSGSNAEYTIRMGMRRGVYFAKVVSYGNGPDIAETDLLEYLAGDTETKAIALYIEGIQDGKRFFKVLRNAAQAKPVMVLKGGSSEIGRNAALSHTGSVTGSAAVWSAAVKQAGAVEVKDLDEFLDLALLFNNMAPPRGRNSAIIGIGGGFGVFVSDTWSAAGLSANCFPPEISDKVRNLFESETGASYRNPVELFGWTALNSLPVVIGILADAEQINNIMIHLPVGFVNAVMPKVLISAADGLASLPAEIKRRLIVALHAAFTPEDAAIMVKLEKILAEAGLPVFPSAPRAANALNKFISYHEHFRVLPIR